MEFIRSKISLAMLLVLILATVVYDSRYHFDSALVEAKKKHQSAQRNWSVFYSQREVYEHSPLRYVEDIHAISELIDPQTTVLSDLATSYYLAATLPVYVPNIHRHQGRYQRPIWAKFIDKRYACYTEIEENSKNYVSFISNQKRKKNQADHLMVRYFIVNSDKINHNLRRDCLAFRARYIEEQLMLYGQKLYQGEYLTLFTVE